MSDNNIDLANNSSQQQGAGSSKNINNDHLNLTIEDFNKRLSRLSLDDSSSFETPNKSNEEGQPKNSTPLSPQQKPAQIPEIRIETYDKEEEIEEGVPSKQQEQQHQQQQQQLQVNKAEFNKLKRRTNTGLLYISKSRLRSGRTFRNSEYKNIAQSKIENKQNLGFKLGNLINKGIEQLVGKLENKQDRESDNIINRNSESEQESENESDITENKKMVDINVISSLINNNIPTLTGESIPEIKLFLKCSELVHNCLEDEESKDIFRQLLVTRLKSPAFEILEGSYIDSFEKFKKIIITKLLIKKPYHILRAELNNLHQMPGENIYNFGKRITTLLEQCIVSVPEESEDGKKAIEKDLENQALQIFKSGIIDPNLRWFCLSSSITTLTDMIIKASELESAELQNASRAYTQNFDMSNPLYNTFPSQKHFPQYPSNCPQNTQFNSIYNTNSQPNNHNPNFKYQNGTHNNIANVNGLSNLSTWYNSASGSSNINKNSANTRQHYNSFNNNRNNYNNNNINNKNSANFNKNFNNNRNINSNSVNNNRIQSIQLNCGFCGKKGHIYAECRTRKNTPFCTSCKLYGHNLSACSQNTPRYNNDTNNRQINTIQYERGKNNTTQCNFCRRRGHDIKDCLTKLRWEKDQQNTVPQISGN